MRPGVISQVVHYVAFRLAARILQAQKEAIDPGLMLIQTDPGFALATF